MSDDWIMKMKAAQAALMEEFAEAEDTEGVVIAQAVPVVFEHLITRAAMHEAMGMRAAPMRYVLENGTVGKGGPLPDGYEFGPVKNCYQNAADLVLLGRKPDVSYTEGVGYAGLIPCEHAWLTDADGRVIDVTWRPHDGRGERSDPATWEYLGVQFSDLYLRETALRREVYGLLDDRKLYEDEDARAV